MGFGSKLASLFGFGGSAPKVAPPTRPNGGDGVIAYAGYLTSPERNAALVGSQKWITYANAVNMAIVATGVRYRCDLLAGAKWSAIPNEAGGPGADRGAELVDRGLIKARMDEPWESVVRKASLYKPYGFSLHEWSADRVGIDDAWEFIELAHRPQHTVDRWDKTSEQEPWNAIGQLTAAGNRYVVPRNRLFYCRDSLLTDQPDGVGLLRHVAQLVTEVIALEGIEGHAYETDLRGTPVGWAPFRELMQDAKAEVGKTTQQIEAAVNERTQSIRSFLQNQNKTADKQQYLYLDSSLYSNLDQSQLSQGKRWGIEILRGDAQGLPQIDVAIRRKQLEIARVLGIEFAMLGADGKGSHALSSDKTSLFASGLQTTLSELGAFATRDLAAPLVGLNGLDVKTCCPTLVAQPISTEAVDATCRALQLLAMAGGVLPPDWEGFDVLMERMQLPPLPEMTPAQMGMLGASRRPRPGPRGGPPDPALGEVDVPVADLSPGDTPPAPGTRRSGKVSPKVSEVSPKLPAGRAPPKGGR